ncbi:hypothetical protein ACFVT2_41875 [Streptomyces sp. NPDC058000]|uniref:hypothetical protein n=1 Tax=Streptomyces sp. NPDC058000 TaxID=3346299 RepID=UPI0036E3801C
MGPSPVAAVDDDVQLPDTWWQDLNQALDHLAGVPTSRQAVREQYIRRRVPEYTGINPGEITFTSAHGARAG